MASTSETGHGKNVDNAQKRLVILTGMGALYKPSVAAHGLAPLKIQIDGAAAAHTAVSDLAGPYKIAIANRKTAYSAMSKTTTRIKAAALSSEMPEMMKNNVDSLHKKVTGQRIGDEPVAEEGKAAPKSNSVSRMSFVSRLENFEALANLLGSTPGYAPNETENKVATMQAYVAELKALNTTAFPLEDAYGNAMKKRNVLLYADKVGLIDVLEAVKGYVFSIGEKAAAQHKSLIKLPLKKYKLEG